MKKLKLKLKKFKKFSDFNEIFNQIQWKLDLADTSLAETLGLKETLQKIWATVFLFLVHKSA